MPPSARHLSDAPAESRRFGRTVGKIAQDGPGPAPDAVAAYDIVLVRATPASDLTWLQRALQDYAVLRLHDLHYFRLTDRPHVDALVPRRLDGQEAADAVESVFAEYRNHWTYDPFVPAFSIADAYVEWTAAVLSGGGAALAVPFGADPSAGVAVVAEIAGGGFDIALAGVRPTSHGQGVYRTLCRAVWRWAVGRGASYITISTESWNEQVMDVWRSEGYQQTSVLSTYHLIRRSSLGGSRVSGR